MFLFWTVYSAGVTCTWRRKLVCLRLFPSTFTVSREYAVNLFFFLRREMRKAHLPDYPAAPCISARLPCFSVYIHEMTMLHCVYPRDCHAALCVSTRLPCWTVYIPRLNFETVDWFREWYEYYASRDQRNAVPVSFPIIINNKMAYARTWEVGGIIAVLNLRPRHDLW